MNQVIWNNKHINITRQSVIEKHLLEEDFLTVGDVFFRRVNRDLSPIIDRFNTFAPELPVTARADPRPFYPS